ncbi:ribonuclease P/MRP protein subunit POP7, partial [Lecanoromycetidae sp. Uapishka_2]
MATSAVTKGTGIEKGRAHKLPRLPKTVKRVRKLLSHAEERSTGKIDLVGGKDNDKQKLKRLGESLNPSGAKTPEEVVLKATNRAIERVLGLALFFQGQDDCVVRIRTSSVGTVDDIVEFNDPTNVDGVDGAVEDDEREEEDELPESRIRKMSVVEVAVTLR